MAKRGKAERRHTETQGNKHIQALKGRRVTRPKPDPIFGNLSFGGYAAGSAHRTTAGPGK